MQPETKKDHNISFTVAPSYDVFLGEVELAVIGMTDPRSKRNNI